MNKMTVELEQRKQKLQALEERKYKLVKGANNVKRQRLNTKDNTLLKKMFFIPVGITGIIGAVALTGIIITSETEITEQTSKEEIVQVDKVETEAVMAKAPLKETLVEAAILPVKDAKIKVKENKVVLEETKGKLVHTPLEGEIKKIEKNSVSIETKTGEVVEIKNVKIEKPVIGEKLLQGEVLGSATDDVEVEVKEKGQRFEDIQKMFNEEKTEALDVKKFIDWYNGVTSIKYLETNQEIIHLVGKLFQRENLKQSPEGMIYPSVPTAQMIVETGYLKSELAMNALNLGGIKVDKHWKGEKYNKKTKEQDKKGKEYEIYADFKKYSSFEEYVADYFDRMQQSKWFKERYKDYYATNSKTQEEAIENMATKYATDKKYAEKLTTAIISNELKELDKGVLEVAKGEKTVEELQEEIVAEFEQKHEVTVATDKEIAVETTKQAKEIQENKEKDIIEEPFASDNVNVVEFKGEETPLNEVNFAIMDEEGAKEMVQEMVDMNIYLETKNAFLEKLLKKANINGVNQELTGNYNGKYLDFLMEVAYEAIENGSISEEHQKMIDQRKEGKLEVNVEGKTFVVENPKAIANFDPSLIKKFEEEYARVTYAMPRANLKGLKVTLDAGHALKSSNDWTADPGATSVAENGRSEAQINYEYTLEFKEYLELMGAEVVLLNADGSHKLKANQRGVAATNSGNDVLFSIHFNGTTDVKTNGTEVVIGDRYSAVDKQFAEVVQKHQLQAMVSNDDRGVRTERSIGMLGSANSPKGDIIVEGSFITNVYGMMQTESDVVKYSLMNSWISGLAEINGTLGEETPQEAVKWQEAKMKKLAEKLGKDVEEVISSKEQLLFAEEKVEETESKEEIQESEEKETEKEEDVVSMLGLDIDSISQEILNILA